MRKIFVVIVCAILIIYLGIIYESQALIFFALTEGFITLFMLGILCATYLTVENALEVPITLLEEGVPVRLHIKFNNRGIVACKKCKIGIRLSGTEKRRLGTGRKKTKKINFVVRDIPVGESEQIFEVPVGKAGVYNVRISKVTYYDWFGFLSVNKWVSREKGREKVLFVLPKIHELMVILGAGVLNFYGDSELYDDVNPGYDPAETFAIREFRQGDRLQNIHWKLTAKEQELMVRENSLPKTCAIVMFLEMEALEWAMSVSYALIEQKCPHYLAWNSNSQGEILRGRIEDEEGFYRVFFMYMQDENGRKNEDIMELYREKYPSESYAHRLYFMENTKLKIDDRIIKTVDYTTQEIIL